MLTSLLSKYKTTLTKVNSTKPSRNLTPHLVVLYETVEACVEAVDAMPLMLWRQMGAVSMTLKVLETAASS